MRMTKLLYAGLALGIFLGSCSTLMASRHGDRKSEITKISQSIHIKSNDRADGDVNCFGCSVKVDGNVAGDLAVFGGTAEVNGSVAGDVAVFGGELKMGPGASIAGDVAVFGGKIQRDPSATIGGQTTEFGGGFIFGAGALGILGLILVVLSFVGIVLYLVVYAIAGRPRIEVTTAMVGQQMMTAAVYGMGVAAVGVALILGAAFGLGGSARAIVIVTVALFLLLLALVGNTAVALWLGRLVAKTAGPLGAIAVGALLMILMQFVPIAGSLAHLFFQLVGLGAAALTGLGSSAGWLQQNVFGNTPPPPGAGTPAV